MNAAIIRQFARSDSEIIVPTRPGKNAGFCHRKWRQCARFLKVGNRF